MSENLSSSKDLCRICEDTNYLINVMAPGNEHLYKKLSDIEGMQNDKDYETFSSLFKFICTACENSLEGWHDFRTQCINTRKKLMGFSELEIVEAKSFDDKEEVLVDPPRDPLLPNDASDSVDIKEEEDEDCHDYAEEPFDGGFEEEEYKEEVIEVTEPQHIYEHVSTVYPALTAVEIIKKFLCKDCPKSFNKKISLDRHRVTHPQNKTLCVQCETTFEDRKMLVQHVLWIHEKMKKHYCHKCNRMFANQTDLDAHIESHGLTKFSCPVCQQAFVRMRMLEEHIRTHVAEDVNMDKQITQFVKKPEDAGEDHEKKQKMCHKCGEMYVGEKSNHHRIKHFNDQQPGVSCAICSETFLNLDILKKHMMIHMKDAPFKCDLCDKSFKYKHKLGYHMETHTGDKKFKCGYCEFGFTRSFQLHNHMRKAHMNEMQGDESSEESEADKVEEVEDVSVEETEETMEIDAEYLD